MPRFVVLMHDWPMLHWDLMLEPVEPDAPLWTWRLAEEPQAGRTISVERLPDHRRRYLDYEGPLSGNRGTVICYETGTYTELTSSEDFCIQMQGRQLRCLARFAGTAEQACFVTFERT